MQAIKGQGYKIEWHIEEFLKSMNKDFKEQIEKEAAENIEQNAKQLCPVGNKHYTTVDGKSWANRTPGTLRDSIKAYKSKFKNGGWIVNAGDYNAYYASFVELGTKKMAPKPFLRPALHKNKKWAMRELENISVQGLMTMPPYFNAPEKVRPYFAALRQLRDQIQNLALPGISMAELSMGMTGDFEAAIQEGATLVRIGTAIFGERR